MDTSELIVIIRYPLYVRDNIGVILTMGLDISHSRFDKSDALIVRWIVGYVEGYRLTWSMCG